MSSAPWGACLVPWGVLPAATWASSPERSRWSTARPTRAPRRRSRTRPRSASARYTSGEHAPRRRADRPTPWRRSEPPDPALALDSVLARHDPAGTGADPRYLHGLDLRASALAPPRRPPHEPALHAPRDPLPPAARVRDWSSAGHALRARGSPRTAAAGVSGLTPRSDGAPRESRSAGGSSRTPATASRMRAPPPRG